MSKEERLQKSNKNYESVEFIKELISIDKNGIKTYKITPPYTHSNQWQGLTDDEIDKIVVNSETLLAKDIARAIEQALRIKNDYQS